MVREDLFGFRGSLLEVSFNLEEDLSIDEELILEIRAYAGVKELHPGIIEYVPGDVVDEPAEPEDPTEPNESSGDGPSEPEEPEPENPEPIIKPSFKIIINLDGEYDRNVYTYRVFIKDHSVEGDIKRLVQKGYVFIE